jgi:hypothetical protein
MPEDRGTQEGSQTDEDKVLMEFKRNEVVHAITTVSDFSKSLITLTSGFFVAYFALLKFLGLGENITV